MCSKDSAAACLRILCAGGGDVAGNYGSRFGFRRAATALIAEAEAATERAVEAGADAAADW